MAECRGIRAPLVLEHRSISAGANQRLQTTRAQTREWLRSLKGHPYAQRTLLEILTGSASRVFDKRLWCHSCDAPFDPIHIICECTRYAEARASCAEILGGEPQQSFPLEYIKQNSRVMPVFMIMTNHQCYLDKLALMEALKRDEMPEHLGVYVDNQLDDSSTAPASDLADVE